MRKHWKKYRAMAPEIRKKAVKGGAPKNEKKVVSPRNKLRNLISASENRANEKLRSMRQTATKLQLKSRISKIIKALNKNLSKKDKENVKRQITNDLPMNGGKKLTKAQLSKMSLE